MIELNSLQNSKLTSVLLDGGVGVMPTDTLYGLICCAQNKTAVEHLYSIKSRTNKPGTVIAASVAQLVELGIKKRYLKAVEQFWPNPLSIVIPAPRLDYLSFGKNSLALRIPKDKNLLELLSKTGPLLTTSANLPGKDPAVNILQAKNIFGKKLDFYVDGVDFSNHKPSTVIEINDDAITILRVGACKIDEKGRIS